MSNELPPPVSTPEPMAEEQAGLTFEYWPQLILGVALASGILSLGTGEAGRYLAWLPLAALVGWLFLGIIRRPRAPQKRSWADAQVEARVAGAAPSAVKPVAPAAAQTPAAGATSAPAEESKASEKAAAPAAAKPAAAVVPIEGADVVVLWGSETGNAEGLAEMTANKLNDAGLKARAMSMGNVKLGQLATVSKVLVITSTWGDGEPPSNAIDLWEAFQKESVDLSNTRFSVLALGDTAYPQFCQCGKDFDKFLEEKGGKRVHPRVDCDLDYEAPFEKWLAGVTKAMQAEAVPA